MTKVLQKCDVCKGTGTVPSNKRALLEFEIRDPSDFENFKTVDLCDYCGGSGKRGIEVE